MRLLKVLLLLVLFMCISWGGVLIFGPKLIKLALDQIAPGAINVQRLQISPKLEVSASMVEFSAPRSSNIDLTGSVRGLRVDWSFEDALQFRVELGPTQVNGRGSVSSANLLIVPKKFFSWSDLSIDGQVSELRINQSSDELSSTSVQFSGQIDLKTKRFDNPSFKLNDVAFETVMGSVSAPNISVSSDNLMLSEPLSSQNLSYRATLEDGFDRGATKVGKTEISGTFGDEIVQFAAEVAEVSDDYLQLEAGTLSLVGRYDLRQGSLGQETKVSAAEISLNKPKVKLTSYRGALENLGDGHVSWSSVAHLESAELSTDSLFIGKFEGGALKIDSAFVPKPVAGKTGLNVAFAYDAEVDFKLTSEARLDVDTLDLTHCTDLTCTASHVAASVAIDLAGEQLSGESRCTSAGCGANDFKHRVTTSDTDAFFSKLMDLRLLNPLVLQMLYAQIRSGTPVSAGHVLEF